MAVWRISVVAKTRIGPWFWGAQPVLEVANSCYLMARKWNLQIGQLTHSLVGEQFWGRAVRCVPRFRKESGTLLICG